MSGAVRNLKPTLTRIIVVRQSDERRWRVEAYERQASGWRFTWLLSPDAPEKGARRYAAMLARRMGLPVADQPLGDRVTLVDGILGRGA